MMYRQGDILLNSCDDILKEYEEVEREEDGAIVLAHGEATGHRHAIHSKNVLFVKSKNDDKFFIIVTKDCDLVHEEHSKITLPIGNYQVIRQREYTPERIIYVAD